jgi:hypothetical protein
MAEFAISMQILLLLLTVLFLYFIRLPPLPWALPVIGYLHHVTATQHKSSSALTMSSGRSKGLTSASVQLASILQNPIGGWIWFVGISLAISVGRSQRNRFDLLAWPGVRN